MKDLWLESLWAMYERKKNILSVQHPLFFQV